MENIKIDIPQGYEIDLENSDLSTGKISFKEKLTYENIAKSLFMNNKTYYADTLGSIGVCNLGTIYYDSKINCTSEEQTKKLLAINQLMNIAKYLNGNWNPNFKKGEEPKFFIYINDKNDISISTNYIVGEHFVYFRTKELARKAVEILGEETIRLIFGNY